MRAKTNAFLAFIILVAATALAVARTLPPSPLPAAAPAAEFSAERAIEHIRAIAATPRPTGSPALAEARAYVLAVLADLGLETETQPISGLENVMGRIPGTDTSGAVLLTAHLDSVASGPGATDDGSGVAVLLETARALAPDAPFSNTVIFLFTDNEEGGYRGARAFVANHPWASDVRLVVGLDAGGLRGPGVLSAISARNGWLIRQLARADSSLVDSSAIGALSDARTDFARAFRPAGYPGYGFDLYWDGRIHTPADNVQNVNPASIQHQGQHALSLARHFANLTPLADPGEPDAVYFSVLRLFVVRYSSAWAIPLAATLAGLFGLVLAFGLRHRILTWAGVGYGALVLLAGLVIAPLPVSLLAEPLAGLLSRFAGPSLVQPLQVLVVALSALALTILWHALARRIRSTSLPDLTVGALLFLLAGTVGTAIAFPALSYAFAWPLLFSLLATANWFYASARRKNARTVIPGLLLAGAASAIVLVPAILLGLFDQIPLTLVFLAALSGFFVPHIHLMLGATAAGPEQMKETGTA